MNLGSPEPCERPSARKSHGEPHVIARIWLLMASHGGRSPRLTLTAGRTVGCNAGHAARLQTGARSYGVEPETMILLITAVGSTHSSLCTILDCKYRSAWPLRGGTR
jgi:hypothetical protein